MPGYVFVEGKDREAARLAITVTFRHLRKGRGPNEHNCRHTSDERSQEFNWAQTQDMQSNRAGRKKAEIPRSTLAGTPVTREDMNALGSDARDAIEQGGKNQRAKFQPSRS
mmetsp:Transcript_3133/g.6343  ORF Transcript_3133/g.6343 Transcript_3133/m.6343 type:complete len:111 (-) Transcript_3133:202-534(-)